MDHHWPFYKFLNLLKVIKLLCVWNRSSIVQAKWSISFFFFFYQLLYTPIFWMKKDFKSEANFKPKTYACKTIGISQSYQFNDNTQMIWSNIEIKILYWNWNTLSRYCFFFIEFQQLRKVNMCMMLYFLQTHEQLETVLPYIPANVPISGDDIIPGVEEINYSEQG